ncbi:Dabb family protein [Balneola sp. MJW-20]|uniref:Dabb family protein n=1 Tax=Gracilimonas aurantiaca TaxID=3234185 RepID=UPI003467A347
MIKHIVMWKLKDNAAGSDKAENAKRMKNKLEALQDKISELHKIEVGITMLEQDGESISDIVLTTEFKTQSDLKTYAVHPAHQEVVNFIKEVVSERRVVDYIL